MYVLILSIEINHGIYCFELYKLMISKKKILKIIIIKKIKIIYQYLFFQINTVLMNKVITN